MSYVRHYKRNRGSSAYEPGADYGVKYASVRTWLADEDTEPDKQEQEDAAEEVEDGDEPDSLPGDQDSGEADGSDDTHSDDASQPTEPDENGAEDDSFDEEPGDAASDTADDGDLEPADEGLPEFPDEEADGDEEVFQPDPEGDEEAALAGDKPVQDQQPVRQPFIAVYDYSTPEPVIKDGVKHRHFRSVNELTNWLENGLTLQRMQDWIRRDKWPDGTNRPSADSVALGINMLKTGDTEHAQEAQDLLDKFTEALEVPTQSWSHDIHGFFPDVAAYVSGDPEHMWTRVEDTSDRTPLRVWVGLHSSWQISQKDVVNRGIALAAFAMALINKRPVYLTPYWNIHSMSWGKEDTTNHGIVSFDLKTSPLVLSQLLAAMTRLEVTRYVGCSVSGLDRPECPHSGPFEFLERKHLDKYMKDEDLFIPAIEYGDPLLRDPINWVKTQLQKYGAEEDA